MTRWRVDFEIKSDLVLSNDEKSLMFIAPEGSHEVHLFTRRGKGLHAADELYLSAHVILIHEDPWQAGDIAEDYLREFLDTLAVAASAYFRIKAKTLVADWTPGLTQRRCLIFKEFPNPDIPLYGLRQELMESVKILTTNPIPLSVRLGMQWWARGVSASFPNEQFQFFWYALEILAEYTKPSIKMPSKCPVCKTDLYCQSCSEFPLHRPYPKQALKMLIDRVMRHKADEFFKLIDKARNALLHGKEPKTIEQDLNVKWENLSDDLGKVVWAELMTLLTRIASSNAEDNFSLAVNQTNTFVHYHVTNTVEAIMGTNHADPLNPQIEEFMPSLEISMLVTEHKRAVNSEGQSEL